MHNVQIKTECSLQRESFALLMNLKKEGFFRQKQSF